MKVCDYIADYLAEKNIENVFGIIGGACAFMVDAIGRRGDIKFVCFQHEQAAAMAAEAYARVTKNIGVTMVTSGPGATNLITGTCCAWFDSISVLNISGQVNSWESTQSPNCSRVRQVGFQETDIINMVKGITKYAILITKPEEIKYHLDKAFYYAFEGRPGPVWLDIPMDIQRAEIDPKRLIGFTPKKIKKNTRNIPVSSIAGLLNQAKRPLMLVGGGLRYANLIEEARKLVGQLGIPVVTSWSGFSIISHDNPLYVGNFGVYGHRAANFAIQNCDLLIALGSRLDTRQTGGKRSDFARYAKKVVVDVDPYELNKDRGMNIDLAINADLRDFFSAWNKTKIKLTSDKVALSSWTAKIKEWKKRYPICLPEYQKQKNSVNAYVFTEALSKVAPNSCVLIPDCGGNLTWTMQGFVPRKDQLVFSAMGNSPMGYSFAASLGAAIAAGNKKPVICIIGDGGMQVNIQELQTMVHYKIPVKVFLLNSDSYAIIINFQKEVFEGRRYGVDKKSGYSCPNFIKVARAYGLPAVEIKNHNNLEQKIKDVLLRSGPVVCVVKVDSDQCLYPKTQFGNPLENMYPFLPSEEVAANMIAAQEKKE